MLQEGLRWHESLQALAAPLPLFTYRLYSLWRSTYVVARDGMRLRWGLRVEDIPISDILWVYRADEVEFSPSLPLLRWPGNLEEKAWSSLAHSSASMRSHRAARKIS